MTKSSAKTAGAVAMVLIVASAVVVSVFKEWFQAHVREDILLGALMGSGIGWALWMALAEQLGDA